MVGQRTLNPLIQVRILAWEPRPSLLLAVYLPKPDDSLNDAPPNGRLPMNGW